MKVIRPVLTPARLKWLTKLAEEGPASRPRGCVGYDCIRLGWTEWVFRNGPSPLERITEAGRAQLGKPKAREGEE